MHQSDRQKELRLWLIAGAVLYPGWAFVLHAAAPETDMRLGGRLVLGALCLVLVALSRAGKIGTEPLVAGFTAIASAVSLHAVGTAVANQFHAYYLVAAAIVVLAISLVIDSHRYLALAYAAIAVGSLAIIGWPDTADRAFLLCSVLTSQTVGFIAISGKLRLVRSLRRSADDLSRMQAQMAQTAALAKIGGWSYGAATGRMRWTDETYRLFGLAHGHDADGMRWETLLEHVASEDRMALAAAQAHALANHEGYDLELDVEAAGGRSFRARMIGAPVVEDGKLVAVRGSIQDVSDTYRLKSEVKRRETHLRALVDATPGLVSWVDADLRYLGVNRNLAAACGLAPEAFLGKPLGFLNPGGSNEVAQAFRDAFASGRSVTREISMSIPGGEATTFLMNVRTFDEGRAAVCVGLDIAALKRTERELEEQRDLLAKIMDHLPLGLFVKDAAESYRFVAWNRYMELKTGVPRDLVIGRTDYDLFPKEDADSFRKVDEWVMGEDGPLEIPEEHVATPDGKIPVRTVKVPVRSREHALILGVLEDISEEKLRDGIINEQRAKLVHASRMSTLGEMSGGIAHEINNPLTVIHGFTDILQAAIAEETIQVSDVQRAATRIRAMCDRIAKIVKGLRAFSRDASHDPFERISVERIVRDSLELCQQRLLHHGVALQVGELVALEVDCRPIQVSQVLLNLLHNAFDAVHGLPERWVRVETRRGDGWVEIEVVDAGTGIPGPVAAKMMQPFFTTKPPGQGTGLGLSISKGIVETHGGQLLYDTHAGHTRFRIRLPLRQSSQQAA